MVFLFICWRKTIGRENNWAGYWRRALAITVGLYRLLWQLFYLPDPQQYNLFKTKDKAGQKKHQNLLLIISYWYLWDSILSALTEGKLTEALYNLYICLSRLQHLRRSPTAKWDSEPFFVVGERSNRFPFMGCVPCARWAAYHFPAVDTKLACSTSAAASAV